MADVRPLGLSMASGQSFGSYGDFVYVAVCNRHQWRIIEQFGGAGNVEQTANADYNSDKVSELSA